MLTVTLNDTPYYRVGGLAMTMVVTAYEKTWHLALLSPCCQVQLHWLEPWSTCNGCDETYAYRGALSGDQTRIQAGIDDFCSQLLPDSDVLRHQLATADLRDWLTAMLREIESLVAGHAALSYREYSDACQEICRKYSGFDPGV